MNILLIVGIAVTAFGLIFAVASYLFSNSTNKFWSDAKLVKAKIVGHYCSDGMPLIDGLSVQIEELKNDKTYNCQLRQASQENKELYPIGSSIDVWYSPSNSNIVKLGTVKKETGVKATKVYTFIGLTIMFVGIVLSIIGLIL